MPHNRKMPTTSTNNNVKLRPTTHSKTGEAITEVWSSDEQELLGVIYPTPGGIKLVSKLIINHPHTIAINPDDPPAIFINLEHLLHSQR